MCRPLASPQCGSVQLTVALVVFLLLHHVTGGNITGVMYWRIHVFLQMPLFRPLPFVGQFVWLRMGLSSGTIVSSGGKNWEPGETDELPAGKDVGEAY